MRVLLLTQVLPYPPDSGAKVKTWNWIKFVADRHELTLISFVRGDQSADVRRLARYCRSIHTVPIRRGWLRDTSSLLASMARRRPFVIARDDHRDMWRLVRRISSGSRFDIIHADQLNMAQYALVVGARTVLDMHNALWVAYRRLEQTTRPGLRRWLLKREWRLLKRYEGEMCRRFDAVLAVSEEDRSALLEAVQRLNGAADPSGITVVPIGIDPAELDFRGARTDADRILSIETMLWPPNAEGVLWFAREVLPLIRQRRPEVQFDIVGAHPPRALMAVAAQADGIHVLGYVVTLQPLVDRAGVLIVPLQAGSGMRVKILTALAQGVPVVSTGLGCEGIRVRHGVELLIADTAPEFADAVLRVLADPRLAAKLAANGRHLIESTYDYRIAYRPIESVYAEIIGGGPMQTEIPSNASRTIQHV